MTEDTIRVGTSFKLRDKKGKLHRKRAINFAAEELNGESADTRSRRLQIVRMLLAHEPLYASESENN